jgi:zinc transport system permease protein
MMLEILGLPLMQRALVGGMLIALMASFYGPFIVQRKLAFLGSGLAHAAFGGVALGMLLGVEPLATAIPFTVAVAVAIVWVRAHTDLTADSAIGVFISLSMALGVIFLFLREQNASDATTFLFGSILALKRGDLYLSLIALGGCVTMLPLWRRWAYATFDETMARVDRHPVLWDEYLLMVSVAILVVISVKIVGILLVSAFLVIPAASARLIARRFIHMTWWTLLFNLAGVLIGLLLSFVVDVPSGPAIILVQSAFFLFAFIFHRATRTTQ